MATAAHSADTRHHDGHDGHGMHPVDRKTRGFRASFLSPLLFWLGSMAWLAGAATHLSIQPRTGYRIGGDTRFTAGAALFVAGAGLFVLASFIGLAAAYAEAALVRGCLCTSLHVCTCVRARGWAGSGAARLSHGMAVAGGAWAAWAAAREAKCGPIHGSRRRHSWQCCSTAT